MNVVAGWVMFVIAAVCWLYADVPDHPLAGYIAGAAGALAVGIHHARSWHNNPWEKRYAEQRKVS